MTSRGIRNNGKSADLRPALRDSKRGKHGKRH